LPGERRYRGVLGLPLCLALAASYIQKPIPENHVYLGEIDLCRNVRDVPQMIIDDLVMSLEMAESPQPFKVLGPPSAAARLADFNGVEAIPVRKLEEAFFHTWPELR
jgi:predicted ATP-dependent serine protease